MAFCGKTVIADSPFDALEFNHSNEYMQFAAHDTLSMIKLAGYSYYYAEGLWYSPFDEKLLLQQDTVIDKVLRLPTVQQKSARIDSLTCHRHGISLIMLERADWPSDTGRYILQAGYRSSQKFDTFYLFKVCQPDLVIKTLTKQNPTANP
jgi:hypothetical protein